ncbi:hypothetical protein BJ742DRAFT_348079 [Cladochytrium replicatum]|nr:hypothetical protein BJ742DRAFT_348079 [Cladochytrium replicatum]
MTADLVLYHYSGSTADITLRILNLLGVPFDLISIESKAGDLKTASYLALNPNGLVPLLVHKGTPIFESAAITIYLGETFGEARDLFPSRGPLRGEALKWIVWGTATLSNRLWTLYGSKSDKDLEAVSEAMRVLDNELKNKEFLLGSEYSIVDTHVAEIVGWMSHTSLDMNQFKTVASYCERCKNRVLEDVNMDTAEKKSSNAFIDAFDTVVFDAPPAKVYALLTESNEFATWSGTHAAIPHQHGVEFKTHGGNFLFKFVTCITDKMIVAHFREERWEWDGFATVMFALIATGSSKTTLNFSIYGVPGGDPEKKQHVQAWQESFFEPMKAYLKRGAPAPFCGVDIQVKDLNRAERFYKTTFNWTFTEMPEKPLVAA